MSASKSWNSIGHPLKRNVDGQMYGTMPKLCMSPWRLIIRWSCFDASLGGRSGAMVPMRSGFGTAHRDDDDDAHIHVSAEVGAFGTML